MKNFVRLAKELGKSVAGHIQRAVDPPLAEDAKPLDIRNAVIEAIERFTEPIGKGRRALPGRHVRVRVLSTDLASQRALRAGLADLTEAIVTRLREIRCDVPRDFRANVVYLRRRPADWQSEQRIALDWQTRAPAGSAPTSTRQPILKLVVTRGRAAKTTYTFTEPLVLVGRSEAPIDEHGRTRRNHVAFLEDGTEPNNTVTRGHCHIKFDKDTGEYRVFDEGSANGTRITRAGTVIEVHARDPVGAALVSGDELELGTAAVRVHIVEP